MGLQHILRPDYQECVCVCKCVRVSYSDLLVDHPVLYILVKLLLGVHVDPVGSQLFPDLHTKVGRRGGDRKSVV